MINLFLDDLRDCPDGFILVKELDQEVNIISLDHDLGENEPTGYDFVKYLIELGNYDPSIYPKQIFLHTANGVGRDNMFKLLERYKPDWVKLHRGPMPNND